ncbi:MAG: glycosyltransferase family 39 protein [Planctomycetota bacterium]
MGSNRTQHWLWGILTLALVLRLVAAVLVQHHVSQTPGRLCLIAGDAEGYWELGQKLARGENFEIYQPPRKVLRMPGFPALLAASIALFGDSVGAARGVLALIGTLACGGVYWLGAELFNRRIGLIATALAAVSPTFVVCSVMILSETAFALGLLISLISLAWLARAIFEGSSATRIVGLGVVAGIAATLACYVRPSWLLFPPLAGAWMVFYALRRTRTPASNVSWTKLGLAGVALVAGMVLGLAPWTYRNYVVTGGHFVPTTLWMGPSLYDGLNPEANGDSHMEFLQHDALYQTRSEYDVDRHYRHEAWSWAAKHPGKTLELAWIKLGRYWNLWPNTPQFDHWAVRLVLLTFLVPIFGGALWSLVCRPELRATTAIPWTWICVLTLGPILYFSGLHLLFVSSLRYRLPAEYPLLILTAIGLEDLVSRAMARYKKQPQT